MNTLELLASELVFMASYLGAEEFYGIENPFFGMSEKETHAALEGARATLAEKRYAALDFDGNFSPSDTLKHLSRVYAFCERYVSVDVLERGVSQTPIRFYFLGSSAVRLSGERELKLECLPSAQIEAELMKLAVKYALVELPAERDSVILPMSALAKAQGAPDSAEQRAKLKKRGCSESFAAILADGFQRQSDYITITLTDFAAKRVDSILCLNSEHGTLRLIPAKVNDVDCWTLSHMDVNTLKTAISVMLNDALGRLQKGGGDNAPL